VNRHRLPETGEQQTLELAVRGAHIEKRVSFHTLRRGFATHQLKEGCEINNDLHLCSKLWSRGVRSSLDS
jgi:site-specific recombinase XerD